MTVVQKRTVGNSDWHLDNLCESRNQSQRRESLTLMMTSAKVVATSVTTVTTVTVMTVVTMTDTWTA